MVRSALPLLAAALLAFPAAAPAQSLGLSFAETSLSADESATEGRLTGDWAITGAHGFQLDVALARDGKEMVGQIDGHLYLSPRAGRKYGFFASLADVDGREAAVATAGIEGMVALGPRTVLHGRAALGYAEPGGWDFVSADGGFSHALSDRTAVQAAFGVTEVDEAGFGATLWQARLGLTHHPVGAPVEIGAALVADRLTGRDAAPWEARAELSVTFRFGAGSAADRPVSARAFPRADPLDPLFRRGLF